MTGKTLEERVTGLECELRDLKTRLTKVDGEYAFRDKRFRLFEQTSHQRQAVREEAKP